MKAKKSVAIVMALLLVLSVCSSMVFAAGVSEGYSSGFEDGGKGWIQHTVVTPADKATAAEGTIQKTADAYEGENYAVLKNNVRTISPEVTVEPGKDYEISIAYNATSATTLCFYYLQYTAAGTQKQLVPMGKTSYEVGVTTVANTWTVLTLRTGEIAADTRKVQVQALCWVNDRVAIDAFSVRECSWENFQGDGNAGFEKGVTGWTSSSVSIKNKTEVADIVEGEYCAYIGSGTATSPEIPVLPGKSYRLSFYYKTTSCSFYKGIGSVSTSGTDTPLPSTSGAWGLYEWNTGEIPAGKYAIRILFRPWAATYFDGFRLFELSETVTDALEDGDFEDGITSFNTVGATEETEIIHNGAKSLKLEGTADTTAYAEKNFIALSGRAYTATAYFKATALSGDGAKLSVVNGKTGAQVAATDYVKRTSGAWRKMTVSIPSTAPSWLRLKVEVVGQGTVYFDDIRVFEGADSGTAAYDGTFESGLGGFEVENALVSSASGTVHAGAKSAKLTATAEAPAASIAASTTIEAGKSYYVTAYFKAASLPAGDGEGAKLSVVNDLTGEVITALANVTGDPQPSITTTTEFFKTKTDTWRKMMVCIPTSNVVTTILVKAELVGEGEVYFDDIQVEQTDDLVFNGDFEGLTSDTKLAGGYGMRTTQIDSTKGQGNSIKITTKGLQKGIQIPLPRTGTSTICRLSFDYYTNTSAYPAMCITEINCPTNTGTYYGLLSNNLKTNEWGHHEFYYRGGEYFTRYGALSLDASNMFPGSSDTQFVYYDNVKIEVVCANADLTGGNRFETMSFSKETVSPGDTITATYSEMNPTYATAEGRQVTALFGIYKKVKEGVWALVGAKTASGKAPKATNFNGNYSTPTDYSAHGISPLQLTAELSIPQDAGEYGIKAFVWDSTETREPLLDPYTLNMN